MINILGTKMFPIIRFSELLGTKMTPINKLLGTKMFPIRTLQIYKDNKDIKNLKREEKDFFTKVYYNSTKIITKIN